MVNAIWVILLLHQSILKIGRRTYNTLSVYKDDDFVFGHIDVTHLDIIFFFAKLNEMEDGNINHLIGDGSIKNLCILYKMTEKVSMWQYKIHFYILNYFYYNLINLRWILYGIITI